MFRPTSEEGLPSAWNSGGTIRIRAYAFGVVPLGVHTIHFESVDHDAMTLQTREHEPLVKTWDHRITVEGIDDTHCRYTDEIEVGAGVFTLSVWLFAHLLFANRHRQWKRYLAKRS